jgi:hypothetical protein
MKRPAILLSITFLLASLCVASVQGRGGTFVVEPARGVTDSVELNVSDSALGDISVNNGPIDFYVTSPSELVILCYNDTAFTSFNFTAEEEGTYTMHLANTNQAGNVTVLLSYGVNLSRAAQVGINFGTSTGIAVVRASPIPIVPFDWLGFFRAIAPYVELAVPGLIGLWRRWKDRNWKKKYEKVVVTKPSPL